MKIAAVLFILSVCYIASTEQAAIAAPDGVHTYPRSWDELQRKTQQGMAKMTAANGHAIAVTSRILI